MSKAWLALAALLAISVPSAQAMTIKEFKKFSSGDQSTYIGAAVNMLAYTYAANGNPAKSRCILNWYFGEAGKTTPGPAAVTVELAAAERRDPDKYHIEGIILGLTDQACSPRKPSSETK